MKGIVAAGHPDTVAAGIAMREAGGNAVGAAVAAAFASFVAEAVLVNIGGGGIALVVDTHTGEGEVYDFLTAMPGTPPYPEMDFRQVWVDFGSEQQPFYIGRASVAVPGAVAGLCALAEARGRLPLPRLLEPAIRLAREGVVLTPSLAYVLHLLLPIFTDTPEAAELFAPGGRPYQAGERLRFPQLADALERLGREGPALFYAGEVGQAIVADQARHGGLITAADMASYRVARHRPIRITYRGRTVLLPPPPSSGGGLVAFALKLLEVYPVAQWAHNGTAHVRTLAEVMRLTNVARPTWELRHLTGAERVRRFLDAQHITAYREKLHRTLAGGSRPVEPPAAPTHPNTTHISVADAQGLVVSLTTTAGESAGFLVGDTGVMLNNMLGEHDLHPEGFHRLAPGERLATMMTPTVVLDGDGYLVVGSGGSSRIRSAILQVLSNVLDFHLPLEQAVNAPRVHFEADVLQLEGGIAPDVADGLRKLGYRVNPWPERNLFFGGAHAVARHGERLQGAGDMRRGGVVGHA